MIHLGEIRDEFTDIVARPIKQIDESNCEEWSQEVHEGSPDFYSVYTVIHDNTLDCIADLDSEVDAQKFVSLLKNAIKLCRER